MNPSGTLDQTREKLQQEYQRILTEVTRLREFLQGEVDVDADEADPDVFEREKTVALIQTLERKLDSLSHALRTAERGLYGICERCGGRIDPARLKALPDASLCVRCKAEVERLAKRRASWNE